MPVAPYNPRVSPWEISDTDFARASTPADQILFLLHYAILAPSGHNTQPWKFQIEPDRPGFVAYADYDRRLPVVDPDDRELFISIGAAVFNFRVAAARFGYTTRVEAIPGAGAAARRAQGGCEAVARVSVSRAAAAADLAALLPVITRRRTNRAPYAVQDLSAEHRARLEALPAPGGPAAQAVGLHLVTDCGVQAELAALIARGDRLQMSDPAFRQELANWVRPVAAGHGDGMVGDGLGVPDLVSWNGSWFIRSLDLGQYQARRDERLAREAAALAIIYGPDTLPGLLAAGELHEHFLLTCTALGLQYGYLNQPLQWKSLRPAVRAVLPPELARAGWPQLLLRCGYGSAPASAMPRRPVASVLI